MRKRPANEPKPKPLFLRPNPLDVRNIAEAEQAFGFTGADLLRFALMQLAVSAEKINKRRAREKAQVAA